MKDQAQLLTFTYPQGDTITTVEVPNTNVKLLVMNTGLADRTWIVGQGNARSLVIGPHYASPEGELEVPTKAQGHCLLGGGPQGNRPAAA